MANIFAGTGTGTDSQKWPDIRPTGTGTGYPVHPYDIYAV